MSYYYYYCRSIINKYFTTNESTSNKRKQNNIKIKIKININKQHQQHPQHPQTSRRRSHELLGWSSEEQYRKNSRKNNIGRQNTIYNDEEEGDEEEEIEREIESSLCAGARESHLKSEMKSEWREVMFDESLSISMLIGSMGSWCCGPRRSQSISLWSYPIQFQPPRMGIDSLHSPSPSSPSTINRPTEKKTRKKRELAV